ncbi:MAG: hypothetical protein JW760_15395 [Spirochaetales bacterium]|nr:hypothetical protein [Spirochaetales bacterium]
MKKENILDSLPRTGFLKISREQETEISSSQKSVLIRRGNELFNAGEYETAKRIFITTGYTDGLVRMGCYYEKNNNPLEALRMYYLAPAPDKKEELLAKVSAVIRKWIIEDKKE